MKRGAVLLTLLLPAVALAQQPPAAPPALPRVCVPQALLERLVANAQRQPWESVATLMDQVRAAAPGLTTCDAPAPPPAPAPDR